MGNHSLQPQFTPIFLDKRANLKCKSIKTERTKKVMAKSARPGQISQKHPLKKGNHRIVAHKILMSEEILD